jgi:hypothetical protein
MVTVTPLGDVVRRLCLCRDCTILVTDVGPLCDGCVTAGCVELVGRCRRLGVYLEDA